jgi:hypothetical protein
VTTITSLRIVKPATLAAMFIASRKAGICCGVRKRLLRGSTTARRIVAVALLPLLVITLVTCSGVASAQAPPDEAHAYIGLSGIEVEFTACLSSAEANCFLEFSIYRNPPGFTQNPIWDGLIGNADHTITDTGVKIGQSYTYQVCGGGLAETNRSNCRTTNTVKLSAPPPPTPTPTPAPKQNPSNENYCPSPWLPPQNLSGLGGGSQVSLRWTNPNQPCPAYITHNVVNRLTSAAVFQQLAKLDKAANNGPLPDRYVDTGPLLPHTSYYYEVCESDPDQYKRNCADSKGISTWGADPILMATRVNATTVKLQIAVDQAIGISSLSVTREGSDDPCRQGGTLGNGLQGCRTVTTGPNGVPMSPAHITTVYNWTQGSAGGWTTNSTSAPYLINIPNDTGLAPGVEYYYQAHVVWVSVGQDSATVTVPNAYATAPSQSMHVGGPKPISNAPPAPKSSAAARQATAPMLRPTSPMIRQAPLMRSTAAPGAGNLDAAIKDAQAKPGDAQALYALGEAYCARRVRNTGVSYMYMALLLAEKAGNAALAAQIKTSLAEQGAGSK